MREFTPEEKELIVNTPITESAFDMSNFENLICEMNCIFNITIDDYWTGVIRDCEKVREIYLDTHNERYFIELVRLLPNSYKVVKL